MHWILTIAVLLTGATTPVIVDTDIGTDIDDAYALALVVRSPELELLGVTTVSGDAWLRAHIAGKLLAIAGYPDVPVYSGQSGVAQPMRQADWASDFESDRGSVHYLGAVDFIREQIDAQPGRVVILCLGQLTNMEELLTRFPEARSRIGGIVLMGGSITGRSEWNFSSDPKAARTLFASGVPILMAPIEATESLRLDRATQGRIQAHNPLMDSLDLLRVLWDGGMPVTYDPAAVAALIDPGLCDLHPRHIEVDDAGVSRVTDAPPNAMVCERIDRKRFFDLLVTRLNGTQAEP